MLRLGRDRAELTVVEDQFGAPTSVHELAGATARLLADHRSADQYEGLFHLTAPGRTSWYAFACLIMKRAGYRTIVKPIPAAEYPSRAVRPQNSVLNCDRLFQACGLRLAPWEAEANRVLDQLLGPDAPTH